MPDQTRRDILKAIALGAALAAVGGAATYYMTGRKEKIVETVTTTLTEVLTQTKTITTTVGATPTETATTTARPKISTLLLGPCRYCGTGCGVKLQVVMDPATGMAKDILAVIGDPNYPVNRGALCVKAFYIHKALGYGGNKRAMELRFKKPLVNKDWIIPGKNRPPITPEEIPEAPRVKKRQVSKNLDATKTVEEHVKENFVEIDWDTAIKFLTAVLKYALNKYGPHSFAYYGSGQLGTEESYVINKLTKGGIHTNNLDGNPRLCMVSAVGGYISSFGADEPEVSYDYIDVPEPDLGVHADTFMIIGSNTAEAHPILFGRISEVKKKNPNAKVILADPRKTRSGTIADLWLPIRWSMDVALLHTLAHIVAFELDKCKVIDVKEGKVECKGEYIDLKWLKRHADFAIPVETAKTWALKDYNTPLNNLGDLNKVWDMGTTASNAANYKVYPSIGKKYTSEEEIEKDWWRGFALYLKFLEFYKPEVMAKILFGDQKPLINKETAEKLIKAGELSPDKVKMEDTPFIEIDPVEALRLAAKWIARGRILVFWTMGINQKIQGVHAVNSIINLLALTGKIGKYGSGTWSLTGQPNACGGIRDQGGLAHVLPYGRLIAKKAAREQVEKIWRKLTEEYLKERGYSPEQIKKEIEKVYVHPVPGPHAVELFRRIGAGIIKVVWIAETNPGHSLPNVYKFRLGMVKPHDDDPAFPFVIVSDIYPTRTTDVADLILPAAAWSEKEFKYGCSERRYSVARYLITPPGEAVADHIIFAMVGKALEDEGIIAKGLVSGFFPEDVDKAAKAAGKSWVQYIVEKSRDKKWHQEFVTRIWDRDILSLAKNTYYDFSYVKRELFRKLEAGFRWPWPEQYATNPSVKARYEKYKSCGRYSYPYDPLMPDPDVIKKIYNDIKNMNSPEEIQKYIESLDENVVHPIHKHKWLGSLAKNPVLMKWVLKHIVEEIDDIEYKKASKVPESWYVVFYAKPTGRMTIWARPWLPIKMDHETGEVKINKEVIIQEMKLDANLVLKQGKISVFAAPKGPFTVVKTYKAYPASGDPEKALKILETMSWGEAVKKYKGDIQALFEIALAPAEVPGFALRYRTEDGRVITVRDATEYPLVVTTGRIVEHWHTATMTGKVPEIMKSKPEAYVEIPKELAEKLGIKKGDWVTIESPRGKLTVKAVILDPKTGLGGPRIDYVFVPWFDPNKLANALTLDNYDVQPYFFQPDFKTCAARIRKARPDEIPKSEAEQTGKPKYSLAY
ncbi:Nitrate reductase [Pyrolobus fumarii 1A]|uniref:Nitrate reductase n=1 Tax=Pyrolobus fumarii (strain DSM 11204 / 1A) TaxID=694429 RepID=G0EGG4_PYRF1|nr:molybdopterin oxidoreductase family protein [Pyrolobus fumarii]AEM39189.1 Nitrate reductase [Pyrolobus fumarii 1A]